MTNRDRILERLKRAQKYLVVGGVCFMVTTSAIQVIWVFKFNDWFVAIAFLVVAFAASFAVMATTKCLRCGLPLGKSAFRPMQPDKVDKCPNCGLSIDEDIPTGVERQAR